MKKITLLFLFLTLTFSVSAQFPEGFANGLPADWTTFIGVNGLGTAQNWSIGGTTDPYMRCADEDAGGVTEDWLVSPITSITATNSSLSFYEQTLYNAPYEPATMSVRVSTTSQTDISTFTSLSSLSATEVFNGSNSRTVDLAAYEGQDIYIAWVLEQNYGDGWIVDNFSLNNQNATAPNVAENLAPADGATDVAVAASNMAVAISWDAPSTGDPATGYEIHWGSVSGALNVLGTTTSTAINVTGTSYNTTIYWKIVPVNAGGAATGAVEMSFTTMADPSLSTDKNAIEGFKLFPTVVQKELNYTSTDKVEVITIFNILGQKVYTSTPDAKNASVDISALQSGVYSVQVKVAGASGSYKIIKE